MSTPSFELIILENGDIGLQRAGVDETLVQVKFSSKVKDYLGEHHIEVAKQMIDSGIQAVIEWEQAAAQAARTAEISVDASRKAVRAGTARVTDVLLALAQSTRAKRDLNEAKFQRAMGWLELELAIGVAPESLAQRLSDALHGL